MINEEEGVLVLLDTPPGLGLVLDLYEWTAGEHFLGVKRVPPGPHLCVVKQRDGVATQHFWWWAGGTQPNASAWCWSADRAEFVAVAAEEGLRAADPRRLGEYAREQLDQWRELTRHVAAVPGGPSMPRPTVARRRGHDRTAELEAVGREAALGWLEAAFAEFSLGQVAESFELWRELLLLGCGSVAALRRAPDWCASFCGAAARQLRAAGPELVWQEERGRNQLLHAVSELVRDVRGDAELPPGLQRAAADLAQAVPQEDDADEDGPVIVPENELCDAC